MRLYGGNPKSWGQQKRLVIMNPNSGGVFVFVFVFQAKTTDHFKGWNYYFQPLFGFLHIQSEPCSHSRNRDWGAVSSQPRAYWNVRKAVYGKTQGLWSLGWFSGSPLLMGPMGANRKYPYNPACRVQLREGKVWPVFLYFLIIWT